MAKKGQWLLSVDETLEMIESMVRDANKDCDHAEASGDVKETAFWEGWAGGLETLRQHMKTDVKVSCFPVGSCTCHPFTIERRTNSVFIGQLWQRAWLALKKEKGT